MKPSSFEQQTDVLRKPDSMTDEECSSLPVWSDGERCISLWTATWRERLCFLLTGKVWLWVWGGPTQPPVAVSVDNPFEETK